MLRLTSRCTPDLGQLFSHLTASHRLRKSVGQLSDEELDRLLASTGRTRRDLFTVFQGNATHRRLMALMIQHFGLDLDHAIQNHWDSLKQAERTCVRCSNVKRCRNWVVWDRRNDAPRIFCPNADFFDEISSETRI